MGISGRTKIETGLENARAGRPVMSATVLGFLAVLFWGSSIAFGRKVMEQLGIITAPMLFNAAGGVLSMLYLAFSGHWRKLREFSKSYWLFCGGLFIIYAVCMNLAVGTAADGRQVLEVALINYLWPSMTVLLSIPILRNRAKWTLLPGLAVAFAGVALAIFSRNGRFELSLERVTNNFWVNPLPYLLSFICAVTWSLYSNLTRRLAKDARGNPVPVLLVAVSLLFLIMRPFVSEPAPDWTPVSIAAFLYMALVVNLLAYVFWDYGVRKGNTVLVMLASFFIPVLATLTISLLLGVTPGVSFWAACIMVVAGALIAKLSIREPGSEEDSAPPFNESRAGKAWTENLVTGK